MGDTNKDMLLVELNNDKAARNRILEENKKLEEQIKSLEKELHRYEEEDPTNDKIAHVDTEKYKKYLEQRKIKENLRKQIDIDREKLHMMIEARTDITELNVDTMSQAEIIRIVKQLERRKVNATSKLNGINNRLDALALEISRLQDTIKMYQTEIEVRQRKKSHSRLQKHRI